MLPTTILIFYPETRIKLGILFISIFAPVSTIWKDNNLNNKVLADCAANTNGNFGEKWHQYRFYKTYRALKQKNICKLKSKTLCWMHDVLINDLWKTINKN